MSGAPGRPTAVSQDVRSGPQPWARKQGPFWGRPGLLLPQAWGRHCHQRVLGSRPQSTFFIRVEESSWYLTTLSGWKLPAKKTTLLCWTPASGGESEAPGGHVHRQAPTRGGLRGRDVEHYGAFRKTMCLPILALLVP